MQVFLYLNMWIKHGELVYQAERKLRTSTHIPDLDNANVGMYDVDFRRVESEREFMKGCTTTGVFTS